MNLTNPSPIKNLPTDVVLQLSDLGTRAQAGLNMADIMMARHSHQSFVEPWQTSHKGNIPQQLLGKSTYGTRGGSLLDFVLFTGGKARGLEPLNTPYVLSDTMSPNMR